MNIYVIERHQGEHDEYEVTPVKAYEEYYKAKDFINICNEDIKPMLEKMEEFDEKYNIGICSFRDKFSMNNLDMISDDEYQDWEEKRSDEYNKILETFIHDNLEFADSPIRYKIKTIELIENGA